MDVTIHDVSLKEFLRLLPVMFGTTEWKREGGEFYMSGRIRIKELGITLYSEDYKGKLGVAKAFEDASKDKV